jgi:sigma-B regulation protein RsbU (phosphoserine phosphatase)
LVKERRVNPVQPDSSGTQAASILIVDDTPANLQVLAGMLKDRKYRVRPVPSGKLALQAAHREPPDLILLDINMPEMNGYEVCEKLKADEWLRGIPVIFISALTEPLDKVRAFGFGGVDYITKPFQMEELYARVETHLKIRRLRVELEDTNARLERANERMSKDLRAAARIQQAFLPPVKSVHPGTELAWAYKPCDELGGDGLNIIPLGGGLLGLCVLDVSGHGVPAALLSVAISRLLSPASEPSSILFRGWDMLDRSTMPSPCAVADELNRLFRFDREKEQFATLLYGVLEVATGIFRYVAAGHEGPLHFPKGGVPVVLESPGFPIGMAEEAYEPHRVQLAIGDRLYLYTDGLTETMNGAGEAFGSERLVAAVGRLAKEPLGKGVEALLEEVDGWRGTERRQDDISLVALEYLGEEAGLVEASLVREGRSMETG